MNTKLIKWIVYWWNLEDESDMFSGDVNFSGPDGKSFCEEGEYVHGKITTAQEFFEMQKNNPKVGSVSLVAFDAKRP